MQLAHSMFTFGIAGFLAMTVVAGSPSSVLAQAQPSALTAFVTSQTYSGNLGGVAGADAQCQQLAEAVGLSGQYKAWLSDGTSSPATTFARSTGPYVRTDGTQIAANWDDLIDGDLDVALDRDEYQNVPPNNPGPWTGTNSDGTSETPNCAAWTDASGEAEDRDGGNHGCTSTNAFQWTSCGENWCDDRRPLYCFEQLAQTSASPPVGTGGGADRFTDHGNGTFTDTTTGLMWEKKVAGEGTCIRDLHAADATCDWNAAMGDWIAAINAEGGTGLGGYNDWRVPSRDELKSLTYPAVSSDLPGEIVASYYWTSTSSASDPDFAWSFNFSVIGGSAPKTLAFHVRAVRGGP